MCLGLVFGRKKMQLHLCLVPLLLRSTVEAHFVVVKVEPGNAEISDVAPQALLFSYPVSIGIFVFF
jgi:methionine-rich copper-binding protein CopC